MLWILVGLLLLASAIVGALTVVMRLMHGEALSVSTGITPYDLEVMDVGDGQITLRPPGPHQDLTAQGRFGLQWVGGYARVQRIIDTDDDRVTRSFTLLEGALPPRGSRVRMDTASFPPHPTRALGLDVEAFRLDGPLGPLPVWITAGKSDTWLVAVHGKGAGRAEGLRLAGPAAARGWPVLIASYRNDAGAPARPSRRYGYGRDEWEDLEVAIQAALDRGARRIFLAGFSMGGAIVGSFMRHSALAEHVCGIVLDSPMLDFAATLDHGMTRRGMPRMLSVVLRRVLTTRYGLQPDELDYMSAVAECGRPVLVFHGDADPVVPYSIAQRLAQQQPADVALITTHGAGHVRSWNQAPERYEAELGAFFDRVSAATSVASVELAD